MKEKIKNTKGITLIALVVTIIILLILAGVTINVALGDNGLFKKSQEAVNRYKSAEANEAAVIEDLVTNWDNIISGGTTSEGPKVITGSKTSEVISKITGTETENTKVTIGGEEVIIPAGFTISPESAENVSGGIVVVDDNNNEWVWVPCTSYERHDWGKQNGTYSDYSEEMPTDQSASITKNKGYYIGRYEAGNDGSGNVIIQENKTPYNNIAIADCKTKSDNFASTNGYDTKKMFTTLCSSYAWDSSLTFIEKTNVGYATNSTQGNYSGSLKNTGSTAVCNIYDMGGNLFEYTTESSSTESTPYVKRGGVYDISASVSPAGFRDVAYGNAYDHNGFRLTLFLK